MDRRGTSDRQRPGDLFTRARRVHVRPGGGGRRATARSAAEAPVALSQATGAGDDAQRPARPADGIRAPAGNPGPGGLDRQTGSELGRAVAADQRRPPGATTRAALDRLDSSLSRARARVGRRDRARPAEAERHPRRHSLRADRSSAGAPARQQRLAGGGAAGGQEPGGMQGAGGARPTGRPLDSRRLWAIPVGQTRARRGGGSVGESDARTVGQGVRRMRIIAGKHRGRAIRMPRTEGLRPTADRVREALFNILEHGVDWAGLDGARVIDAFALEALSRSAACVTFLDVDGAALLAIRRNAAAMDEARNVALLKLDATRLPPPPGAASAPCDLAFLDPPYASGLAVPALQGLAARHWLGPGAIA